MKKLFLTLFWTSFASNAADLDDLCGYAPLCGSDDTYFDWETDVDPDYVDGESILGAELEFTDCCKLSDTETTEDCQIVNPSGESYRVFISSEPICGDGGEDCQEDTCENYQLVINAQFETSTTSDGCCDSCSCFGDPQCIPFSGSDDLQTWILCDGREIPTSNEYCRITEDQCLQEVDHSGNSCVYLSEDSDGVGWTVGMLGSPCIPNPDSPASTILMYSVPDEEFNLTLEQGERGIITDVYLTLACGYFTLNAETCLSDGEDAWEFDAFDELPVIFSYNDVVHGYDQHWSIVDPDSGISVIIRCHGNHYDGDDTVYVPRINVEDISDPVSRGESDGFCVTGDFDYGSSTTSNTEEIIDGDYCTSALEDQSEREIYRAICQNSALPSSAIESCIYHFCSANYLPLYDTVSSCQEEFNESIAEGFCGGIVYTDDDYTKCIEQWYDLGAVETITQYYDDREGCTTDVLTELDTCQDGVYIQYYRSDQWNDEIAIPVDFCSDEPIILNYCDYQYLFNRQIRIVQKSSGTLCGSVSQCTAVEGFIGKISLVQTTPYPTGFPTAAPSSEGITSAPTTFVSSAPTVCVEDGLCGSPDEYVEYEDYEFSVEMDGCCPLSTCYDDDTPDEINRTQGVDSWFCGYSEEAEGTVDDSILGTECEDDYTLTIQVAFETEDCCQKCTCYGDPRCYSFDDTFEEFILCDGRTPGETVDDRCVIRRDTCYEQTDQSGNQCAWTNPNMDPPDYDNDETQYTAENAFSVAMYGSPCRYDTSLSDAPIITMYNTENFLLEVEQGERGYIQAVTIAVTAGEFSITAADCIDGDDWVEVSGDITSGMFVRATYGNEYVWTFEDPNTGIISKVRCTGHMNDNEYVTTFINVEAIYEHDEERILVGEGFCASNEMTEKELASTSYTESLVEEGYCDDWNEDTTAVMKREIARIVTDTPGVTNTGTEYAYTVFCESFYLPQWNSASNCAEDFVDATEVSELIELFCMAVTTETGACEENLQVVAESDGYKSAFTEGYETYVVNYEIQCEVDIDDLATELVQDEDTCETGVELQWYNPRMLSWVTYAAFPNSLPCSGYLVTINYDDHPKLFKNPLRLVQRHNYEYCNSCTEAAGVYAFF